MSYPLQAYLTTLLGNDTIIKAMVGQQPSGRVSVFPYNHRDVIDPVFPLITIARYGTRVDQNKFDETQYATIMDAPKIAICVYDKTSIDMPWAIYRRIRTLLVGPNVHVGNQYFDCYKLRETLIRDDLYDQNDATFHLHAEYETWVRENATTQQPIG